MRTRSLHRGLALSLMGLASVCAGELWGWFDADLAWRDVFLERNVERNPHDLSHWTTGHYWSGDVDV